MVIARIKVVLTVPTDLINFLKVSITPWRALMAYISVRVGLHCACEPLQPPLHHYCALTVLVGIPEGAKTELEAEREPPLLPALFAYNFQACSDCCYWKRHCHPMGLH